VPMEFYGYQHRALKKYTTELLNYISILLEKSI
jgi:hypothetical protein